MPTNTKSPVTHSIYRAALKDKISISQKKIRKNIHAVDAKIIHRTQAINAKRSYQTLEEEQVIRQDILSEQIKVWRQTLPSLLHKLSRIPDPRRPKSIKHKMAGSIQSELVKDETYFTKVLMKILVTAHKFGESAMKKDANNLNVSTDNEKAIDEINFFIQELLSSGKSADVILNAASTYPDVLLIQTYAAAFNLYSQTDTNSSNAANYLKVAEKTLETSTQREKLFYYIILSWQQLDYELTLTLLKSFTKLYPQDLAAIKIAEWIFYCTGQSYNAKQFLSMCETVKGYHKDNSHFLAIYAFALELAGDFSTAYEIAQRALTINPLTPWAHHALAHVYMMQGQMSSGIHVLELYQPTWEDIMPLLKGHNTWHLGLLYIAELKMEKAALLYPKNISGPYPKNVLQQMDAISFLWRMEMAGVPQDAAWQTISRFMAKHPYEHYMPYNNAHYVYALIKSGNKEGAHQVVADIEGYARELGTVGYRVWHEVSRPLLRGCLAFAEGDYQKSSALLKPIIDDAFCLGGSDAQVELFLQTYLMSLIYSGQKKLANNFFKKYFSHYELTPLGKSWLEKIHVNDVSL